MYENGLLIENYEIGNYARLDAYITSNPNFDLRDVSIEGGGNCAILRKGTSSEDPIILSCPKELERDVVERIIYYLIESIVYLPHYECWNMIRIENRQIDGEMFDVGIVLVRYFDILGRMTSRHLVEWFFKGSSLLLAKGSNRQDC